jgi:hypothetical protein
VKLHIKDDAQPFQDPPRKYPIHMNEKIKAELERMEKIGVIKRSRNTLTGVQV